MESHDPVVDLAFALHGATIPADHGYQLYAAISRHLPTIHGDEAVGIHPIRGQLVGQRRLALTRTSRLVLRLPATRIPEAIRLAGRSLDLDGAHLLVGVPSTRPLLAGPSLVSRLVVIRGFTEDEAFLDAVGRQLAALQIAGTASLVARTATRPVEGRGGAGPYVRRTLRIRDKEVVGFAVWVNHLTEPESIHLQETGLGGRRRFGCGLFVPTT